MKLRTAVFVIGATLAPFAAYAADTYQNSTAPSATERTKEVLGDTAITGKVKALFAKDSQVSAMSIKVETKDGVVSLSGKAKSKEEADKAVSIAQSTDGVRSVNNQIQVGSTTSSRY